MTADQAKTLEQLRLLAGTGEFGVVVDHPSSQGLSALPIGDLALPAPIEVLPPNHSDDILKRVTTLERQGINTGEYASIANAVTTLRNEVAKRLTALEARMLKLETNDNTPPAELHQMKIEVQEIGQVFELIKGMIEDPTPVMVENDNG
jgi:hypothetical protein